MGEFEHGELGTCEYLLENTRYFDSNLPYGWWTESAFSPDSSRIWYVSGDYCGASTNHAHLAYGIRPAIDVLKTDILY